jgi:transcriptional regulator with XRE-family HTH domain
MLGERICLLRRRQGWSQAELAKRLCISASTVGMYEQGRREPSLSGVVKMSRAFGVSVDYLLTGSPLTRVDALAVSQAVEKGIPEQTRPGGLSREELAVLFAAVLTEA